MRQKGSIVIAFSGRKYLMVRHRQRAWEFPGGRAEAGETPFDTAKREFLEETGLLGRDWRDCGTAELENGSLRLFSCRVSGRPKPRTGEIAGAGFFTAPPVNLSFSRPEYFRLLRMAGWAPKKKTDYDIASRDFDAVRSRTVKADEWTDAISRWGRIEGGERVLDIGCGTGRHTLVLRDMCGALAFGIDYSPGMLERANGKCPGLWLRGDAVRLPVDDGKFDRALMIMVLQHLDDEPLALSEAFRALRPGGILLVATISHSRIRRHLARFFPGLVRIDLDRFMALPELKWHLRNIGFSGVRSHVMRTAPAEETVDSVVERFRKRYISTLALVPDGDFDAYLAVFEKRLREEFGDTVETDVEITFIEAGKP